MTQATASVHVTLTVDTKVNGLAELLSGTQSLVFDTFPRAPKLSVSADACGFQLCSDDGEENMHASPHHYWEDIAIHLCPYYAKRRLLY